MATRNSTNVQNGRYLQGGAATVHKNRLGWWERFRLPKDPNTDFVVKVDVKQVAHPEKIAYDFYRDVRLGWLVMQYNNILDPIEELTLGKQIVLPHPDRVATVLLSSSDTTEDPKNVQV